MIRDNYHTERALDEIWERYSNSHDILIRIRLREARRARNLRRSTDAVVFGLWLMMMLVIWFAGKGIWE